MTFFIYVLAVLTGLGIYEICVFTLKAYRRYRYNREKKKFIGAIKNENQAFMVFTSPRKRKQA